MSDPHACPAPDPDSVRRGSVLLRALAHYHRYRAVGLEHIPRQGAVLLVSHHSFATYDGVILGLEILRHTGRLGRALADDVIFGVPGLSGFASRVGMVPASPGAAQRLLAAGEMVGVAPGGMWESLRPRTERYTIRWAERFGFVRLALRTGTPMLLAACPRADEIFTLYPNRLTDRVYERFHLPLPLIRGLGPTLIPRPVQLTHFIAPVIQPPIWDPEHEREQIEGLHARATEVMRSLLGRR